MHLEFLGESALLAVLKAGLIPQDVLRSPVVVDRAADRLRVAPEARLSASVRSGLERAGVRIGTKGLPNGERFATWPEASRCRPGRAPTPPLPEILFLLDPGEGFSSMCGDLLRLGDTEQQVLDFTDAEGRPRTLVRAVSPSYYVVMRAMEGIGARAFSARAGSVWVQLGFEHPLEGEIDVPEGQLVLVPGRGPWLTAPDRPWVSLEDRLDVRWPADRTLANRESTEKLQVELRFEASHAVGPARLWILREGGAARLEALSSALPEAVMRELQFARLGAADEEVFALRSPDFGGPPPALELDAEAYVPRPDLPRLYLPEDVALSPPLRTEYLATRIADDEDELVWIVDGSPLRAERVAESAFRPLPDFVDYVIDDAAPTLETWIEGALFDFDAYRGQNMAPVAARAAPDPRRARSAVQSTTQVPAVASEVPASPSRRPEPVVFDPVRLGPDEAEAHALALERAMGEAPPADAERGARWLELGRALAAAGRRLDAHQSFARAAFFVDNPEPAFLAWHEAIGADLHLADALGDDDATHAPVDVAAAVLASDAYGRRIESSGAQRWLDRVEADLPVHVGWLLRIALARHVGGDLLGLLRARDGITTRIEDGLALGRDVPSFVRRLDDTAEVGPSTALRAELDAVGSTYASTRRTRSWNEAPEALTAAYVRRLIGWGHARLGALAEPSAVEEGGPNPADAVHGAVLRLYELRTAQAREGRELGAPVDPALRAHIEGLPAFERFKVERLWLGSTVLGGAGTQDAFRRWAEQSARKPLPETVDARRQALERCLDRPPQEASVREVVELLAALPEADARRSFAPTVSWARRLESARWLEAGEELLALAGHLDRAELVGGLLEAISPALLADPPRGAALLGRRARTLARAGFSGALKDLVPLLRGRLDAPDSSAVQGRLHLAVALAVAGEPSAAVEETERARAALEGELTAEAHLGLVRALALTLARTSPEQAVSGVRALLPRLAGVTDKFSTNSHYCVSVLHFMESMVLALTGQDLTIGPAARAWLDEDEAHLRERMHADLRGYDR